MECECSRKRWNEQKIKRVGNRPHVLCDHAGNNCTAERPSRVNKQEVGNGSHAD